MPSSQLNQTDRDITAIVGGSFSPDHLGPAAYQQILRRVQASPPQYLQSFERRFLAPGVDPLTLADLYLPAFLQLLADRAPQEARALGARLATIYAGGVPAGRREDWEVFDESGDPDDTTRRRHRLEQHQATLALVTGPRA